MRYIFFCSSLMFLFLFFYLYNFFPIFPFAFLLFLIFPYLCFWLPYFILCVGYLYFYLLLFLPLSVPPPFPSSRIFPVNHSITNRSSKRIKLHYYFCFPSSLYLPLPPPPSPSPHLFSSFSLASFATETHYPSL